MATGWKVNEGSSTLLNTNYLKKISSTAGFGELAIGDIDREHVCQMLSPHWSSYEMSRRLRGVCEAVIQLAISKGYRKDRYNPAGKKEIELLMQRRRGEHQTRHHPAMPFAEVPAFMARLHEYQEARQFNCGYRQNVSSFGLELQILTAMRPTAAAGAMWSEFES